jgi:hypothetical protein
MQIVRWIDRNRERERERERQRERERERERENDCITGCPKGLKVGQRRKANVRE